MSSHNNRNQIRKRSRASLDRRMDQWIATGKQVVDGVAGNRPGQKRGRWQDKTTVPNFEKVGRWMEDKIDWFFEEEDEWFENEDLENDSFEQNINDAKRPLGAISLRAPKALPPSINSEKKDSDEMDQWPDEQSFRLNNWERKDDLRKNNQQDLNNFSQDERFIKRRNIPKSNRRKY